MEEISVRVRRADLQLNDAFSKTQVQNDLRIWAYPMPNNYSCFLHEICFVFVNYRR